MSEDVDKKEETVQESRVWLVGSVILFGLVALVFVLLSPSLPRLPEEIPDIIGYSIIVLIVLNQKSFHPLMIMAFLGAGIFLGADLNHFLSLDFLSNMSLFPVVTNSVITLIAFVLIFMKIREPFEKLRYVFLGVSLISILYAFYSFASLVQSYLPLIPELKAIPSGFVRVDFTLVISIFKSLFLTGVFSFFERLLRIIEETK